MTDSKKPTLIALTFYTNKSGDISDRIFSHNALSSAASQRIQLAPALRMAKNLGYKISAKSLHSDKPSDITELSKYDICIVAKMSANSEELTQNMIVANLAAITKIKLLGGKIIVLYCDNLLIEKNELGEFYRFLFRLADYIIYPTNYLKNIGNRFLPKKTRTFVIPDPWQISELHSPRPKKDTEPWKIIWFGSNKNFAYLYRLIPKIFSSSLSTQKVQLTILTGCWALDALKKSEYSKKIPQNWCLRLVEWSNKHQPSQLEKELSYSHISIIPSDANDPRKAGASHNRLVDSIRAGCLTVASPLESYKELSGACLIGDDFIKLLMHATEDYERLISKHAQSREELLSKFSPEANSRNWEKILMDISKH